MTNDFPNNQSGPCLTLTFDYHGASQNVQKKLQGTFALSESKTWINNRVVYWNNQTKDYLYWMDHSSSKIDNEHGFWMVEFFIFLFLKNYSSIKTLIIHDAEQFTNNNIQS